MIDNKILLADTGDGTPVEEIIASLVPREEGCSLTLLASPERSEMFRELPARFPDRVVEVITHGDLRSPLPDELERLGSGGYERTLIALPDETVPLQWDPVSSITKIGTCYDLFRYLWKAGIRRVEGINSNRRFPIRCSAILDDYAGIHTGKRCFVIGNGPSLNDIDMTLLKDEITLGSNRGYLGFPEWGYAYRYWAVLDRLQVERYTDEWHDNIPAATVKFYPFEYAELFHFDNGCPVNHHFSYRDFPRFSSDPRDIYLGNTVTYLLLQIAVIMGCEPIYLIGVDHRFPIQQEKEKGLVSGPRLFSIAGLKSAGRRFRSFFGGEESKGKGGTDLWTVSDAFGKTHFHSKYTRGHEKQEFVVPRTERATKAFEHAAFWAKEHGRTILNATPGTALHAFPGVEFKTIFNGR